MLGLQHGASTAIDSRQKRPLSLRTWLEVVERAAERTRVVDSAVGRTRVAAAAGVRFQHARVRQIVGELVQRIVRVASGARAHGARGVHPVRDGRLRRHVWGCA